MDLPNILITSPLLSIKHNHINKTSAMKKALFSLSVALLSLMATIANGQITGTKFSIQYNKTLCRYDIFLHVTAGSNVSTPGLYQSAGTNQVTVVVPAGSTVSAPLSNQPQTGSRVGNIWTQTGIAQWGNTNTTTSASGNLPTAANGPTLVGKDVYAFVASATQAFYPLLATGDSTLLFSLNIAVPATVTTCDKGVRLWNNNLIKVGSSNQGQDGADNTTGCGGTLTAHDPCSASFPGGQQYNNGLGIVPNSQTYQGNLIRDTRQAPPVVGAVALSCTSTTSTLATVATGACLSTISSYSWVNGSNAVVSSTNSLTINNSTLNNPYTLTVTASNGCTTQVQRSVNTVGCFVLPIKLIGFSAIADKCAAQLTWEIATSDKDFERFDVQYSRDGQQFVTVAKVVRNPYNEKYGYSYDQTNGKGYYRLAIIDLKGQVTYSEVRSTITSCDNSGITISPNPTSSVSVVKGVEAGDQLKVTDMLGNVLANYISGGSQATVDLVNLPSGIYSIMISRNGEILKAAKLTKL